MKYVEVGQKGREKQEKNMNFIAVIILVLMGALFIMIGVSTVRSDKEFFKTAVPAMGTISDIQTKSRGSNEKEHIVSVSYEVDGQSYSGELTYYHSGMAVGQNIEIWYQPDNPSVMQTKTGSTAGKMLTIGGGIVFLLLGGWVFVRKVKSKME